MIPPRLVKTVNLPTLMIPPIMNAYIFGNNGISDKYN